VQDFNGLMMIFAFLLLFFGHTRGQFCSEEKVNSFVTEKGIVIKSPKYPMSFPPQTQCSFSISTTPGYQIKLIFEEWEFPKTGRACEAAYLQIIYGTEKNPGGSVKLCGKSPGIMIASASTMHISLHADQTGSKIQYFKLRAIRTQGEKIRLLSTTGSGVADGMGDSKILVPTRAVKNLVSKSKGSLSSNPSYGQSQIVNQNMDTNQNIGDERDDDDCDISCLIKQPKIYSLLIIAGIIVLVFITVVYRRSQKRENETQK
jgi:hypothetical protein